ncbi:MFS general substrate transporter [Hyphodiscus hymeniophilus]|uniref:MFS general substrate transporter n=1 Tax=Hyphodiscus hymeniophilus TaxID=353542 RepID=A0A9P6VJC1_9HELO|nr:MFS general substrate transporter [Hyphodiscus hymeniophilus]
MEQIKRWNVAHVYKEKKLLIAINCIASLSIFFFGYDQGVMGGVNNAKGWLGDKIGRIRALAFGAAWAIFGACLQCSAQNHVWMIFARLINGGGTGVLNAVTPVWATETASHKSRGQFVAIEFTLNIGGVFVAYWLEFGLSFIDGGASPIRWRFAIAFQIIPLLVLFIAVWWFPESPRWLAKVGRDEEARYILGRLRGEEGDAAEIEYQDIKHIVELEKRTTHGNTYYHMLFGIGSGDLHTARRVQLVVWLTIMQEWVGIAGVTIYAPTIFRSVGQGISMFLAGGPRLGQNHPEGSTVATSAGAASASFIFIFTSVFGATWLTVPLLYPAEIFPLQVRAKGNAWGVLGWSIGNGWLTLLCPVMFSALGEKTLYIFGACNVLTIPIIWALYPETNHRTLEEMDLLFASKSIWVWDAEKNFALLQEQNPELVQTTHRGHHYEMDRAIKIDSQKPTVGITGDVAAV